MASYFPKTKRKPLADGLRGIGVYYSKTLPKVNRELNKTIPSNTNPWRPKKNAKR